MIIPTNNVNSSSTTPTEMIHALSAFDNLPPLELILSYIKEDMSSCGNGERGIRNMGPKRYLIGNEYEDEDEDEDEDDDDDDSNSCAYEKEGTSIFNLIIVIDDSWNPRNIDWALHDKKLESWRSTKHDPSSDSLLSSSRGNVYVPSSSDVSSEDDTISNASENDFAKDISIAKSGGSRLADAPDTVVNEEDVQERSNKAAFAQELFMSTLFSK